jgi:hypothetical protein
MFKNLPLFYGEVFFLYVCGQSGNEQPGLFAGLVSLAVLTQKSTRPGRAARRPVLRV